MTRKLVVATFVGVCALAASGCASQVASGGVQAPPSVSTSISVPNSPPICCKTGRHGNLPLRHLVFRRLTADVPVHDRIRVAFDDLALVF